MGLEVIRSAAASAETLWAVLADVERWPTWTRSMHRVRPITEGPLVLGSRIRVKQPRLPAATWVVTELDPGRSFVWRSTTGGVATRAGHEVTPGPAGTSSLRLDVQQSGLLVRPVTLAFGALMRRYVEMEADGLVAAAADRASS